MMYKLGNLIIEAIFWGDFVLTRGWVGVKSPILFSEKCPMGPTEE